MMINAPTKAFMPEILRALAPRFGATVTFEPEYEVTGRIDFPNGRKSYFWHNKFNLNSVASARITQDKGYTSYFLDRQGFKTPQGSVFFREDFRGSISSDKGIEEACEFAEKCGWPVFFKPTRGSQGRGVEAVFSCDHLRVLADQHFIKERSFLLQKACTGRDYRVVVLDGEVISAYERVPLHVEGDGVNSLATLLARKQEEFIRLGRDTVIQKDDLRIQTKLERMGMDLMTVPDAHSEVRLLDISNLSAGGTTIDITKSIHQSLATLCAGVCEALDLRLGGIDIMLADAESPVEDYAVIEVNSSPGLDHYGGNGPEHDQQVLELYGKVLEAIERGSAG